MANRQQIYFALAFVAVAMVLPAGEANVRRDLQAQAGGGGVLSDPNLEASLKEMLGASERAKEKVPAVGNSQMVKECNRTYGAAIEHLNKALALLQGGIKTPQGFLELEAVVKEAMNDYEECDRVFAISTRPSPFIINDTYLKALGSKCNQMAETDAHQT
ncbi:hypothetical protein HRI_002445400 [Hibiscus trionum]|uniref:Pectinesterase inhibitor domain-containing protein n=1 Tax=Hibiscus trionum TaxID=183268 RepID=A0A9W7I388_HIBTR|nr:hypothetical protein HRI_002445400 [Hibiscus trionum]